MVKRKLRDDDTYIRIKKQTRERLKRTKMFPTQSYSHLIEQIMDTLEAQQGEQNGN